MQYLILHKVRGEPAFDVAEKLQIGDEEGWIIPTSGHRAYPYRHWSLASLADYIPDSMSCVPKNWPDHYQTKTEGPKIGLGEVLSMIMPKLKRRI